MQIHKILIPSSPELAFEIQSREVLDQIGQSGLSFIRIFLSDPENQQPKLEKELEALPGHTFSIIGQPPLDGCKIAAWGCDSPASWLWSGSLVPRCPDKDSESQMRDIFEQYSEILASQGMTIQDNCLRTWIFVRNIDDNYAGVVKGRKDFFEEIGLTPETHYISSTGIGGFTADTRIKVTMDAVAAPGIRPEDVKYLQALDNLNPTYEYGVTFERGSAITAEGRRHIFISGTASIDNKGQVMHIGDPAKQTERMIDNIFALLAEDGAEAKDIQSALVYLRNPSDREAVKEVIDRRLPQLRYIMLHAPVCRPTWLVETECVAIHQ